VAVDPPLATVSMAVDARAGLRDDYELKLNSYDLGVDIELYDIVQRLRFEHPEVRAVVLTSALDKVFCAGANIQMLAGSSHVEKVNFCKFTNETRNSIEDASAHSGQPWIAAVNGTASGGGYELALACDEIVLVDDRSSAVSLPELPLLAVLPGTGGLTRVVDKRRVRRDRADVFATKTEGIRGQQAAEWGLVDAVAPRTSFDELIHEVALARAARSDRPSDSEGIELTPVPVPARFVGVEMDHARGSASIVVRGPDEPQPSTPEELVARGDGAWVIAAARELDHALLDLRFNEPAIGTWVLRTAGDATAVRDAEDVLREHADHWLAREARLYWARTLRRLDLSSRSLFAVVEPGSCATGTLAELVLAADRSYMLDGTFEDAEGELPAAALQLTAANDGWYPMANGLSRLATRFWQRDEEHEAARAQIGKELLARDAADVGLVTFTPDDLDWDDEIRVAIEERGSYSPDALTGMEANLRFVGPETMETKIFARLSAWQNWVFQRPNAIGPEGALRRYGTGTRPTFDRDRV
jgi:benzoyl-CoA-dihydrodiol lyase